MVAAAGAQLGPSLEKIVGHMRREHVEEDLPVTRSYQGHSFLVALGLLAPEKVTSPTVFGLVHVNEHAQQESEHNLSN